MTKSLTAIAAVSLAGLALSACRAAETAPIEAPQPENAAPKKRPNANRNNARNNAQNNARNNANRMAGDQDTANAPIPDRDVANALPKELKLAPQLAQIQVPKTNYPIPATKVLYAAPNGVAASDGSDRTRPTTLSHAIEIAPAGGTIVLRGGEYRDVSGIKIERPLTLQNASGETVWIKGSDIVTGWQAEGGAWKVAWDKKFTHAKDEDVDKNNPIAAETDMVFVAGRSLSQVMSRAEIKAGNFWVDTASKVLWLGDDPTGKTVEATARLTALHGKGQEVAGTVVRGLNFAHFADKPVEWMSSRATFENNIFAWNGARGLVLHGANHLVRGNTFACNGLSGMSGLFANNLLFENNRVLFNNIEGFRKTWSAAGTKLIVSKDMTLRNNLYEGNNATALWFDISDLRTNVIGNTVRHNQGLGIFFELCHEGIIAFNVCVDNGVGIMLADSSSARVWNNTLVDNSKGIIVKDSPRVNDGKSEGWFDKAESLKAGATWISTGNELKNNVFVGGRNDKTVFIEANAAGKDKTSSDMIAALNRNAYARSGSVPRVLLKWGSGAKPVDFESLDAFRVAQTGYETNAALLPASPFAANDYHLAPNHSLLSAGEVLPADIKAAAEAAGIKLPAVGVPIGARGSVR